MVEVAIFISKTNLTLIASLAYESFLQWGELWKKCLRVQKISPFDKEDNWKIRVTTLVRAAKRLKDSVAYNEFSYLTETVLVYEKLCTVRNYKH